MSERLGIIGAGMAGARLTQALVEKGYQGKITLIGAEPVPAYNRIQLSSVLAGEKSLEHLPMLEPDWYDTHQIETIVGDPVVDIKTELGAETRSISTQSGLTQEFDHLILATGSKPFVPNLPGAQLPGVMSFRTTEDILQMQTAANKEVSAVVIGGGLLGLEAAHGLNHLGMQVSVIHNTSHLMNRQLDDAAAELLKAKLEQRGIRIFTDTLVQHITGPEAATGVRLNNGEWIEAGLIVFAAGIIPNLDLFQNASSSGTAALAINRGILVNDKLETNIPGIYAIGECCEFDGEVVGIVAPIWDQVDVLADNLTGGNSHYCSREHATQLKVSGIDLFSAGPLDTDETDRAICVQDQAAGIYRRLVLSGDRLRSALLFGDKTQCNRYEQLINSGESIDEPIHELMFAR